MIAAGAARIPTAIGCLRVDARKSAASPGAIGYVGNYIAALVRSRAGKRLDSPALIADVNHARADAYTSLAVIASRPSSRLVPTAKTLISALWHRYST